MRGDPLVSELLDLLMRIVRWRRTCLACFGLGYHSIFPAGQRQCSRCRGHKYLRPWE